jgi:hypothetical protein
MKKVYQKPVVDTEPAFETLAGCAHQDPEDPGCYESPGFNINPER